MTNATQTKSLVKAAKAVAKSSGMKKPAANKKPAAKAKPAKSTPAVFTTVELAAELKMQPKTLRARIRRHVQAGNDEWVKLMKAVEGKKLSHQFADNKTTRGKVMSLLNVEA